MMKMNKKTLIIIIISLFTIIGLVVLYDYQKDKVSCDWIGGVNEFGLYKTEVQIRNNCDDSTFKEISHEYAKDKNHVYFKPMPNAYSWTIILESADPATFQLTEYSYIAKDKNHVFVFGKIIEDANPNDPNTYKP